MGRSEVILTDTLLAKLYAPTPLATCRLYAEPFKKACAEFNLNTPDLQAALLGQMGVETGLLTRMSENLNYRDPARLDALFSAVRGVADAQALIRRGPQAIGARIYAGRLGNGDEASGDGYRFRGAGGLQLTGRTNHSDFGKAIGMTPEMAADYCRTPAGAMDSAAWFFARRGGIAPAKAWDIDGVTRAVNGPAMLEAAKRRALSDKARGLLK